MRLSLCTLAVVETMNRPWRVYAMRGEVPCRASRQCRARGPVSYTAVCVASRPGREVERIPRYINRRRVIFSTRWLTSSCSRSAELWSHCAAAPLGTLAAVIRENSADSESIFTISRGRSVSAARAHTDTPHTRAPRLPSTRRATRETKRTTQKSHTLALALQR